MIKLTEDDISRLIDKHNKVELSKEKTPIYDLKTLLEYGLTFLYAKTHISEDSVKECQEEFSIYKKHKCTKNRNIATEYKSSFLEVTGMQKMEKAHDVFKACWTGHNLAILTSSFILQGYFKSDLLFKKKCAEAGALIATAEKIYLGCLSGNIAVFDPITQSESVKQHHSDIVTSMYFERNSLLTSSLDGTIFYKKPMHINSSGVFDVSYISDDKFLCSCGDYSLVLYENGNIKSFVGHKDRINSISFNKFGLSSSKDGCLGYLLNDQLFETDYLGISNHKRISVYQLFGYGQDNVILYDTNQKTVIWEDKHETTSLDYKENLVAFSKNRSIAFTDLRSRDSMTVKVDDDIVDLKFSPSRDMILVCTESAPCVLDLRYF